MKKFALLALVIPVIGLTFLACTDAGDPYIPDAGASVEILITDLVGAWDDDGLYIRGALTDGQNVQMSQDGLMWEATVTGVKAGTYGYTVYTDDGSKAEVIVRQNLEIVVDESLRVSGDTDVEFNPGVGTGFRLVVTNNDTETYDNIKMKGSWDWDAAPERSGQSEDGVTVYRNMPGDMAENGYEWGVIHDDGSEWGVWLLPGDNLTFDVAADGSPSGTLEFTIQAPQGQVDVALTCDMNDFVGDFEAVYVRGAFNDWNAVPTPMNDNGDGTWSLTVQSDKNSDMEFKFMKGLTNDDYEDVPSDCGVSDGYAGYNRVVSVGTEPTAYSAAFGACPAGF